MEFLFLRHGQPAWGERTPDPGLTELGHTQARRAATRLVGLGIDEVWVSPLRRAQQTAEPVIEALGLEGRTLPWLQEIRPPSVDGLDMPQILALADASRSRTVDAWHQPQRGSEAPAEFAARVATGLDGELAGRGASWEEVDGARLYKGVPRTGRLLLVCHAGTTAVGISHLVGLGQVPWSWVRLYPGHASLSLARSTRLAHGAIFGLRAFADAEHLDTVERSS